MIGCSKIDSHDPERNKILEVCAGLIHLQLSRSLEVTIQKTLES